MYKDSIYREEYSEVKLVLDGTHYHMMLPYGATDLDVDELVEAFREMVNFHLRSI
jgi:hypothetical protein